MSPSYKDESPSRSCTRDGPGLAPSVTRHSRVSWLRERASASDTLLIALAAQGDELGADLMSTYHEYINLTQIRIDRPLKKTFVLSEHERKHPVGPGRREDLLKRLGAFGCGHASFDLNWIRVTAFHQGRGVSVPRAGE